MIAASPARFPEDPAALVPHAGIYGGAVEGTRHSLNVPLEIRKQTHATSHSKLERRKECLE
jgi:hypothetical protein